MKLQQKMIMIQEEKPEEPTDSQGGKIVSGQVGEVSEVQMGIDTYETVLVNKENKTRCVIATRVTPTKTTNEETQ